ncbi:MAG TPA: sugar ABC transporter ATP-binding protein [Acetobacteraceae bacterium]|nr:sugar ABC transporter ATP-binding protein [Acetobacteraceae bacterium]
MADAATLLHAEGVHKSYGATQVLRGVQFVLGAGEIHALLGGNGAGKSTLLKIATGSVRRDAGRLLYRGHDTDTAEGAAARDRGIAVVHQEMALLPDLSVAENIHLPHQRRGAAPFRSREAARLATAALAPIDASFAQRAVHQKVAALTLHERQLVEIARALSAGADVLLLDEPTANLTAAETERLFALLRRLATERGIAIVFVSHRMREIRQIASVCTILRDGVNAVSRMPLDSLSDADIVAAMGQATAADTGVAARPAAAASATTGYVVRRNDNALAIPPGGIIGLAGAPAGPEPLIETLIGARAHTGWQVSRDGTPLALRSPRVAVRQGIGFVSGDRSGKGLLATLPIIDNMLAAARVRQGRVAVRGDEVREATGLLQTLRIKAASLWGLPATLSGGTQQKLLIARWLNLKPSLLVLEEPTRGVDIGTKRDLYDLMRLLAAAGTAILWWSTEYGELVELCDAVLAFDSDGRPTDLLRRPDIDETRLALATGMVA